jgi:excisionase family DNA binding protein
MSQSQEREDGWRYLGGYPAAARYSGLSEMTLRRLVDAGKLRVYKPTGQRKVLLDRWELDALIQSSGATGHAAR